MQQKLKQKEKAGAGSWTASKHMLHILYIDNSKQIEEPITNILMEAKNLRKMKNSQLQPNIYWSYSKKLVYSNDEKKRRYCDQNLILHFSKHSTNGRKRYSW